MTEENVPRELFSYHIFLFPFKWEIAGREHLSFSERTSLKNMEPANPCWERINAALPDNCKSELFNEKNFFYDFTHPILYNSANIKENIIQHYQRTEPYRQDVLYKICIHSERDNHYDLKLKLIELNLFGTGVGILKFYLENDRYKKPEDIMRINHYGRVISPPFFELTNGIEGTKGYALAESIGIEGLNGDPKRYFEDFNGYKNDDASLFKPAKFITALITDFSGKMKIRSVIDDRMFTIFWYGNDELAAKIRHRYDIFKMDDEWYKLLFIDDGYATCQNNAMRKILVEKHTYTRWQKWGMLYGCTQFSLIFLSGTRPHASLLTNFRTIYARMVELTLLQLSTILKFNDELPLISNDGKKSQVIANHIRDLYKNYIHFVDKIYFREITSQEQGSEIYDLLQDVMKVKEEVKGLEDELSELHNYLTILEHKEHNTNIELMTLVSSVIIIPTLTIIFTDMRNRSHILVVFLILFTVITVYSTRTKKIERSKLAFIYIVFLLTFAILFILSFYPDILTHIHK